MAAAYQTHNKINYGAVTPPTLTRSYAVQIKIIPPTVIKWLFFVRLRKGHFLERSRFQGVRKESIPIITIKLDADSNTREITFLLFAKSAFVPFTSVEEEELSYCNVYISYAVFIFFLLAIQRRSLVSVCLSVCVYVYVFISYGSLLSRSLSRVLTLAHNLDGSPALTV